MMEDPRASFYYESVELCQDQSGRAGLRARLRKKLKDSEVFAAAPMTSKVNPHFQFFGVKCQFLTVCCDVRGQMEKD